MTTATLACAVQAVPGLLPRDIPSLPAVTLSQFETWESLASTGLPHSYSAREKGTQCPVLIHLFPALGARPDIQELLAAHVRLVRSVLGDDSRIRFVDLDAETPFVVLQVYDDIDLASHLDQIVNGDQLVLVANFLHALNRAFRSRLYHGALSLKNVRVERSGRPTLHFDYLQRFCTTELQSIQPTIFELYQSDVVSGLEIAGTVVERALQQGALDTVLPPRKLAILRSLCRDRLKAEVWDDVFDNWLEFFEEWLPKPATSPQPLFAQDATSDLGVCLQLNLSAAGNGAADATAEGDPASRTPLMFSSQSASASTQQLGEPDILGAMLGRFRIEELIGRGGMGAVYRGVDTSTGATVAVKILRAQGANLVQAIRRFNKEARILASIRNEHVTQLLDVGVEQDVHYIAMEFVEGIDLKNWLQRHSPLDERSALRIAADIARALVEAHQRNIIHRDIKPENVLLSSRVAACTSKSADGILLDNAVIKLTDFGIAREIAQTQSMEVTRAGGFLGTPRYMSPEQCKGGTDLSAATDVYSLGITLYEMLCGSVPFHDDDVMKLAALHCFEPLTDIRKRNQRVSQATSELVHSMLAKKSTDRPADASQLLNEIERILGGKASDFISHPRLPDTDTSKLWQRVFRWQLNSSPEELWPHVSNTERLNRAVGLPSVEYRTVKDVKLGVRRFGSFRMGGMTIEWEEHPFEWIEGSRMGVLREFASGPFKWFMNTVELKPRADGGTDLVHTVKIEPRNTLGRVVSTIEAGWKGGRALDRVYRRIDESLQRSAQTGFKQDLFENAPTLPRGVALRLEERLDLVIAKGADLDAAHRLIDHLRTASIQELSKIRPLRLAEVLNIKPEVMLDVCLVAADSGLLLLNWDVICPTCRVAAKSESLIANVGQHTECEACDTQFQSNIGNAIEMTFQVHPEIRPSVTGKYCIGGPWHAPHIVTQIRVAANERLVLPLRLEAGDYLLRSAGMLETQPLQVRHAATESRVTFQMSEAGTLTNHRPVREGVVELVLTNELDSERTFRLERTIERDQVVTAATASTLQRFRDLFPEQDFARQAPIITNELSLLVLQFQGLEKLYAVLGDEEAYKIIQNVLSQMQVALIASGGAVVKTTNEGLMGSFDDCAAACRAAIQMQREFGETFSQYQFSQGIAVHRGRTLIAQQNGRIDYFGATVRRVSRHAMSAGSCIVLTEPVFADPAVQELLEASQLHAETLFTDEDEGKTQIIQRIRMFTER